MTGKTTQHLLDIIEITEGPQRVLFIWPEERSITYPMALLWDLLHREAPLRPVRTVGRHTFLFPEQDSMVQITYVNQFPDRHIYGRWDSIILDHACNIHYPIATSRWLDYIGPYARRFEDLEIRRCLLAL